MVTIANNSNTYVKGIISDLEDCSTVVLYRSTRLLSISITNMEYVLENLEKNKNYVKLSKKEETTEDNKKEYYYLFDRLDENNNIRYIGFDTIIYINHLEVPIGFTRFNKIKGLIPEKLKIKTDFGLKSKIISKEIDVEYSLENITEYISLTRKLLIDKPYGFSTAKEITESLNKINSHSRYTNSVHELLSSPEKSIKLNYGLLNNEGFFRLNLITEMTIPDEKFCNTQFGYYKGEVVCYNWYVGDNKLHYIITSLSRKDKFGNPIIYTNKQGNIIQPKDSCVKKVNYFAGRYVSLQVEDGEEIIKNKVWNIIDGSEVTLESNNHVIDIWGRGQVIELPNVLSRNNIVKFLPEVRDLHINIKNYRQTIHLERIIGEWFVFRETRTNLSKINTISKSFLIYTNMTKTITVSEDYDLEPIPINDNILILRTKETLGKFNYDYYNYYVGSGNFISENALMALDIISGVKKEKIYNSELGYIQYDSDNLENYRNKLIQVDNIGSNILDSYLFGFRKYTCPEDLEVPEIVGTLNGLVYYKSKDNKIRLL